MNILKTMLTMISLTILYVFLLPFSFIIGPLLLALIMAFALFYAWNYLFPNPRLYGSLRRRLVSAEDIESLYKNALNKVNVAEDEVSYERDYYIPSKAHGGLLHTHVLNHKNSANKPILLFCHGYSDHTVDMNLLSGVELCVGLEGSIILFDHQGHGLSDGMSVLINDWTTLMADTVQVARYWKNKLDPLNKRPMFLFGESMGGAVAIQTSINFPNVFKGIILSAPMCQIADDMKPHPLVTWVFRQLAVVFPTLPIAPVPDVVHWCFRDPKVYEHAMNHPLRCLERPRLATAYQMLLLSNHTERSLDKVVSPFLVLHGDSDRVTSYSGSELLFKKAPSKDKTFLHYPGAWHALLAGEPAESKKRIIRDLIDWIQTRSK